MIRSTTILLASALLASVATAQVAEDSTSIFRYAQFGPDWIVTLGQPLNAPLDALESGAVVREAPGVYQLGFYESYDSGMVPIIVTIHTDPDDLVTSLRFDYGPGFDFSAELDSYSEMLGEPDQHEPLGEGEAAVWKDGVTRFELIREVAPEGERWHSLLSEAQTRL